MGSSDNSLEPEEDPSTKELGQDVFSQTRWSLIDAVKQGGAAGDQAAEELCRRYWRPLLCFARAEARQLADAEDLVQGFFASFLKGKGFAGADQNLGKLRSYLLAGLINHRNGEWRKGIALKRGAGVVPECLEEVNVPVHETPEVLFEREWARTLLHAAMLRLRASVLASRHGTTEGAWKLLGPLILTDHASKGESAAAAAALEIPEGTLRAQVARWRKRFYAEFFYDEVAATLKQPTREAVLEEMKEVILILRGEQPIPET